MKFKEIYPPNYIAQGYTEVVLQLVKKEIAGYKDPDTLRALSLVNDVYKKYKEDNFHFYNVFIGDINNPTDVEKMMKSAGIESDEQNYYENKLTYSKYQLAISLLEDYNKLGYSYPLHKAFNQADRFSIKLIERVLALRHDPTNNKLANDVSSALFYSKNIPEIYELLTPALNAGKLVEHLEVSEDTPFDKYYLEECLSSELIEDVIKEKYIPEEYENSLTFTESMPKNRFENAKLVTIFGNPLPIVKLDDKYYSFSEVLAELAKEQVTVDYEYYDYRNKEVSDRVEIDVDYIYPDFAFSASEVLESSENPYNLTKEKDLNLDDR